jgi:hypothetical protein
MERVAQSHFRFTELRAQECLLEQLAESAAGVGVHHRHAKMELFGTHP